MIYFIKARKTGLVKIGFTQNKKTLTKRLSALQAQNADSLRIAKTFRGGRLTEKALHLKHKKSRVKGEWFSPTPGVLKDMRAKKLTGLDAYKSEVNRRR